MKKSGILSKREEQLMDFLWEENRPMTTIEMGELLDKDKWNNITLFRTVKSLLEKEYIDVCGMERNKTQYARKYQTVVSKDEYMAQLLVEKGIPISSIGSIVLAMIGTGAKTNNSSDEDEKLIHELEMIIEQIRDHGKDK